MDKDKRSLLGALGVGTGAAFLPGKWVKPVIESVIVPAHAQSTPSDPDTYFEPISGFGFIGDNDRLCIEVSGGEYKATYIFEDGSTGPQLFTHSPSPIGTGVAMSSGCRGGGGFNVTSVTASEAFFNFDGGGTPSDSIPAASCSIPTEDCSAPSGSEGIEQSTQIWINS